MFPVSVCLRLLFIFFSIMFGVFVRILRSLIHFYFNYVKVDRHESICIFLNVDTQLDHLLKNTFFHMYRFDFFVKNQVSVGAWFYFLVFDMIS